MSSGASGAKGWRLTLSAVLVLPLTAAAGSSCPATFTGFAAEFERSPALRQAHTRFPLRYSLFCLACWLITSSAAAACGTVPVVSRPYDEAWRQVKRLPEFKSWQAYVARHPPARIVFGLGHTVQQLEVGKECFTPVTIYSDEGTHFHRWNTFLVGARSKRLLVMNLEGDPVSLREWRLAEKRLRTG